METFSFQEREEGCHFPSAHVAQAYLENVLLKKSIRGI
jgi:hypothetical protein